MWKYFDTIVDSPAGSSLLTTLVFWLLLGCYQPPEETPEPPRAVGTITLQQSVPPRDDRLTGSVQSWKQENIAFEVSGRITFVVDAGTVVAGDLYDEKGVLLEKGKPLAKLDSTRYEQQVESVKSQVHAAEAKVQGLEVTLSKTVPQEIRQAEAAFDLARKQMQRMKALRNNQTISQSQMDKTQTRYDTAMAERAAARARKASVQAQLSAAKANHQQLKEALKSAQLDLEDTVLYAPFSGLVSKTHAIPGAVVTPKRPVATLIVMDPLKVVVAVSAEVDRTLPQGAHVLVHAPGLRGPVDGWVYMKDPAANPATRTYEVQIIVRNRQIPVGPVPARMKTLPRIQELRQPEHRLPRVPGQTTESEGPIYVPVRALIHSKKGYHVLQALPEEGRQPTAASQIYTLKKVPVQPGENRVNILGLYIFRELLSAGDLTTSIPLVLEPDPTWKEGQKVAHISERWMLRPGDVVEVTLASTRAPRGFYVPVRSLYGQEAGSRHVYVVDDGAQARKISVQTGHTAGDKIRIEAQGLRDGMQLVTQGGAWLQEGQRVRIVPENQVLP